MLIISILDSYYYMLYHILDLSCCTDRALVNMTLTSVDLDAHEIMTLLLCTTTAGSLITLAFIARGSPAYALGFGALGLGLGAGLGAWIAYLHRPQQPTNTLVACESILNNISIQYKCTATGYQLDSMTLPGIRCCLWSGMWSWENSNVLEAFVHTYHTKRTKLSALNQI